MTAETTKLLRVDIDKPKFDMETYVGRAKHFFLLVNPLNLLATDERLQRAREVVRAYRSGTEVPYVQTIEEVWREKYLYDSAFHPETGEKMFLLGRMSAQVPGNTFLSACMVIFYKNRLLSFFFQWLNQTFNALVTYTNRSGKRIPDKNELLIPYLSATFGALAVTYSLANIAKSMASIVARLVPFASVVAANCINIPLIRQNELKYGVTIVDRTDCELGSSRKAAAIGVCQVVLSRLFMAAPVMTIPPIIVERLVGKGLMAKNSKWSGPLQVGLVAFTLLFATPLGCAIFSQKSSIEVENLESSVRKRLQRRCPNLKRVFYNRGL